jgi:type IV secretory pathway VirB10-like protein
MAGHCKRAVNGGSGDRPSNGAIAIRALISSLILVVFVSGGSAQGLAALAKKEEERRKTVKSGKVYTNSDLKPDTLPPLPPAAAANASPPTPGAPAPPSTQVPAISVPAGKPEGEKPKDEAYWRTRITAARSALERSRMFADALQSRINALATDFVNRDDPAQRAQIESERKRALAELERVRKEMTDQTSAISDIEEEARKSGVPPGWLR